MIHEVGVTLETNIMQLPTFDYEQELWNQGYNLIAGADEAGRGAWAGPLVAAAVILPSPRRSDLGRRPRRGQTSVRTLRDSKLLSPTQREKLFDEIITQAVAFSIVEISVSEIDDLGLGRANQTALERALTALNPQPDFHLIDYFELPNLDQTRQRGITRGDQLSYSIAAASILAKVHRDRLMVELHQTMEEYGFLEHKGYGTKSHQEAILKHGFSDYHRITMVPERILREI